MNKDDLIAAFELLRESPSPNPEIAVVGRSGWRYFTGEEPPEGELFMITKDGYTVME